MHIMLAGIIANYMTFLNYKNALLGEKKNPNPLVGVSQRTAIRT